MRSHRSRRPSLRSARAIEARVSWMTAERAGSGGNGTGLVRIIASEVRSVCSPCSRSSMVLAPNLAAPTPSPVYPAA